MATRASYLATIETFDTPTLAKLIGFVNTILIPDQDALVKVSFTDMIDKAHSLALTYFPSWTDQTQADFGEFLVELFALNSWKDFWYLNAFAQEAFLQNAKSYVSVALHALRLGYVPGFTQSATASFNITFTAVPAPFSIVPGQIEIAYATSGLIFTNASVINVAAGTNTITVTLSTGRYTNNNTTFNGKSIRIPATNVDPTSIDLMVNGITWTQVTSFAQSSDVSTDFMVLPSDGTQFELVFGLYGYGLRPNVGDACTVTYRVDAVLPNNVAQAGCTIQTNVSGNYATAVVMNGPSVGGTQAEAIESIRQNASILYRTNNTKSIINPTDAKAILNSFPDTYQSTGFNLGRNFFFAVIPANGVPADSTFMAMVQARIQSANLLMGFVLFPSLTSYVALTDITLTAYIYNQGNEADITQQILDYFNYITDPLQGAAYGVGLDPGLATGELVGEIEFLNNVVFQTINGVAAAPVPLSALQIFSVVNPAVINITIVITNTPSTGS